MSASVFSLHYRRQEKNRRGVDVCHSRLSQFFLDCGRECEGADVVCMDGGRLKVPVGKYRRFVKLMRSDQVTRGLDFYLVECIPGDGVTPFGMFFDLDFKGETEVTWEDLLSLDIPGKVISTLQQCYPGSPGIKFYLNFAPGGSKHLEDGLLKTGWHIHVIVKCDGGSRQRLLVTPEQARELRATVVMNMRGSILPMDEIIDDSVYHAGKGALRLPYNKKAERCRATPECKSNDSRRTNPQCARCGGSKVVVDPRFYEPLLVFASNKNYRLFTDEDKESALMEMYIGGCDRDDPPTPGYEKHPFVGAEQSKRRKRSTGPNRSAVKGVCATRDLCVLRVGQHSAVMEPLVNYLRAHAGAEYAKMEFETFKVRRGREGGCVLLGVLCADRCYCHNKGALHSSSSVWFLVTQLYAEIRCFSGNAYRGVSCKQFSYRLSEPPPLAVWDQVMGVVFKNVSRELLDAQVDLTDQMLCGSARAKHLSPTGAPMLVFEGQGET